MNERANAKPTLDRARVEALVREALAREVGSETAAAQEIESAGALLIPPDRGVDVGEPYDPRVMPGILDVDAGAHRGRPDRAALQDEHHAALPRRSRRGQGRRHVGGRPDAAGRAGDVRARLARAPDKPTFLQRPDLGRALSDEARRELGKRIGKSPTLVIIYGDGLSAAAINQHLRTFHGALVPALAARGIAHAPAFFVRRSRVKIMDEIARLVGAQAALFVCGERPGLGFADSISAYYIYQPAAGATDADREVISNINPRGAPARRRRA